MMWEVLSFGDKPYGEMSNQEVSLATPHTNLPPVSFHGSPCTYPHFFFLTHSFPVLMFPLVPFNSHPVLLTKGQAVGMEGKVEAPLHDLP